MTTESQDDNKGAFRVAQDTPAPLSAANIIKTVKSKQRMLLYTDTLQGEQIGRDDLWAISTGELEQLTPSVPLSADSLHKQIESHIAIAQNFNPGPRGQQAIHEEAGHIMKLIADSLPETEDLRLPANFSPHMAYRAAIEAVRAVLIPPTGKLGDLEDRSDAQAQRNQVDNRSEEAR